VDVDVGGVPIEAEQPANGKTTNINAINFVIKFPFYVNEYKLYYIFY